MAAVVGIISRRSLSIKACDRNQPSKSKLVLYNPLLSLKLIVVLNICTYLSNKAEHFSYNGGCVYLGIHINISDMPGLVSSMYG